MKRHSTRQRYHSDATISIISITMSCTYRNRGLTCHFGLPCSNRGTCAGRAAAILPCTTGMCILMYNKCYAAYLAQWCSALHVIKMKCCWSTSNTQHCYLTSACTVHAPICHINQGIVAPHGIHYSLCVLGQYDLLMHTAEMWTKVRSMHISVHLCTTGGTYCV